MEYSSLTLFNPPISNITPERDITMLELQDMIRNGKKLEEQHDAVAEAVNMGRMTYKEAKARLLPWVMTGGVFLKPNAEGLWMPSCVVPLDIDDVPAEKVELLKRTLFEDSILMPDLVFTSPSGRGVKALMSYKMPNGDIVEQHKEIARNYMGYYDALYAKTFGKADPSGCDITRRCFLCHDAEALSRVVTIDNLKKQNL